MTRTCARGDGTPPAKPVRSRLPPPAGAAVAGAGRAAGEEPGGGDVGAELGEGPGLLRALEGAGGGGGPFPDPRGGVGRQVRGEPGHAVPVRDELDPPVRGACGVAFFDADRVVAFPPGAGLGPEPGRNEVPGRAAAGGVGRVGVQEVRLQPGRPGRIQAGGFLDEDPGVLPGDRPGPQRRQGQRQRRRQCPGVGQQGPGGAFADGQDTGDLGHQGHLLCRLFLRGRRRRRQEPGRPGVIGGQLNLQRGGPGLQPGHLGEPVQATVRQIPQRISIPQGIGAGRIGAGRIGAVSAGAGDGSQRSRGRGNGRQGLPALRTPRCVALHTQSI